MVFYNDNVTHIYLSLRHHAQEPPCLFPISPSPLCIMRGSWFPLNPPDSTTTSQKFRPKITGLLHLGYLGPCQNVGLGVEADFSLQVLFVYFRQIAENQPQYALASYSTAAQSNLTALLACYVHCMCTFRIYMLMQTPLITHPSHSRWYVSHMYNIFILYYSDHDPRYVLYSLYI